MRPFATEHRFPGRSILAVRLLWLTLACWSMLFSDAADSLSAADWKPVSLNSTIDIVAPMTGIVLWDDNEYIESDAIQLEYAYVGYDQIVDSSGSYDWSFLDRKLSAIAERGHQAIVRFYYVYVGKPTTVPEFIRNLPDYRETQGKSEGKSTSFPDWSHPRLQQFTLDFYQQLAERYQHDARLAFLQTGFGLWAEYHIYDGPFELGRTFPSRDYQTTFAKHMAATFTTLPWMISVDAADSEIAPFNESPELLKLNFGVFDDSFLCKQHPKVNALNWKALGADRWQRAPAGGEFSYYNKNDQRQALSPKGPNGVSFAEAAKQFHISFIIGSDQPEYQSLQTIRDAGMKCGYRFTIQNLETDGQQTRGTCVNTGVAPIYVDAWPAIGDVRAEQSLKFLLPGQSIRFVIPQATDGREFLIASDRLVPGQKIPFESVPTTAIK